METGLLIYLIALKLFCMLDLIIESVYSV